jgi:GTP-binding protein Era
MAFKSGGFTKVMKNINQHDQHFRSGYIAIVGRPNVGKSTLMNALLQQNLAIVSPKPQTTRHRIIGILNGENHQAIFLDTPGVIEPTYLLQETMTKTALNTMKGVDLILIMVEATGFHPLDEKLLRFTKNCNTNKLLIINKIDKVSKDHILPLIDSFKEHDNFQEIIPISALKADGLNILLTIILSNLPEGEPFYPPDIISNEPERFFVSEIIREQILLQYSEEIPYAATVQVEEFQEKPGRKDYILAIIYVERDSQKGIIIGKGGQALKKTGKLAREGIEHFIGRPVFLELRVQVRKKWRKNASQLKRLGY